MRCALVSALALLVGAFALDACAIDDSPSLNPQPLPPSDPNKEGDRGGTSADVPSASSSGGSSSGSASPSSNDAGTSNDASDGSDASDATLD